MSREQRGGGLSLPIVRAQPPKERAQLNQPSLGLPACASAGEKGGTGWAIRGGAVGGLFPGVGPGNPWLLNLGLFFWGRSPLPKKKKEGELAESIRIASRSWSGESLGCSTVLGLQASRLPPPAFQPQNSEATTADVYPGSLLGTGAFVILLAGGRSTLLIPDTRPATGFLYYSSLSLIYLCPHTFPEAS